MLPDTQECQHSPSPSLPGLPQHQFQQLADEDSPMEEMAKIDNLAIGIGTAFISNVADPVAPTANAGDDMTTSADQVIGSIDDGMISNAYKDAPTEDPTAKITDGGIGSESIGEITEPGAPDPDNGNNIWDLPNQVNVGNTTNTITPNAIIGEQIANMEDQVMDAVGGDTIGNGGHTIGNTTETFPPSVTTGDQVANLDDHTMDSIGAETVSDGVDGVAPGASKGDQMTNVGDQSIRTIGDNTDRLTTGRNTVCEDLSQVNQVAEGKHACNANNEGNAGTSAQILAAVGEDQMVVE